MLLGGLCGKIESCLKQLEPTFPAESEFYDNLQAEYKTAMVKAKESNDKVKSLFRVLLSAVESKKSKEQEVNINKVESTYTNTNSEQALLRLKRLLDQGVISEEEYNEKRKKYVDSL